MDWYQLPKYPYYHISLTQFLRGIGSKCRGISGVQDGIDDGFFLTKYQGIFGWNIAHIPGPRDLQEHNPQSRSTPHEFDHDTSIPSPDGRIFIATALFQQMKMKADVADNLVSRCHCSQHAAD
jgi:hypothetical protein